MNRQINIVWTQTAVDSLKNLPKKVRRGLVKKADSLKACEDPRQLGKPLVESLSGFYTLKYSRYRAVYAVQEHALRGREIRIEVNVTFVLTGLRKHGDVHDVYEIAQRLVQRGIIKLEPDAAPGS